VTSCRAERPPVDHSEEETSVEGILLDSGFDLKNKNNEKKSEKVVFSKECVARVDAHDSEELSGIPEIKL
jgi:hypothetical protein